MAKLTHAELDKEVLEALDDYEKGQRSRGGGRNALAAFTDMLRRKPTANQPTSGRPQQ